MRRVRSESHDAHNNTPYTDNTNGAMRLHSANIEPADCIAWRCFYANKIRTFVAKNCVNLVSRNCASVRMSRIAKRHFEAGADTRSAFSVDFTRHLLDELLANGKTKACTSAI